MFFIIAAKLRLSNIPQYFFMKSKIFLLNLYMITNKEKIMKLSEKQMIDIIKNNSINKCSKEEKNQIMIFAFGEEFMKQPENEKKKGWKSYEI